MNTTQLKKFASEARNILREGVQLKLDALGFKHDGSIAEEDRPVKGQGYILFRGEAIADNGFYERWESLFHRIKEKGFSDVCEEAAYTWFNRLMAIRIMARNGFIAPVLEYTSPTTRIPVILGQAREGQLPEMSAADREALMAIIDDGTRSQEQFALLITAYCESNHVIKKCFGGVTDYTTLLLPQNIIAEGGFVDLINNTDFIVEEDYKSPELIGWLYQFYISEKKDEVFAKKGKFAADEIPAATQIFTPNWIVKYMVQNTLGRIYLDNNPYDTEMRDKMQYLVEPSEPTPDDAIYHYDSLEDLLLGDLACGSGHILNEMFDLLYLFYIEEGYSRRKAIENIFLKNLVGIDLDTRAKQLAQFALLVKACQKELSFLDAQVMPQVLDMPSPLDINEVRETLPHFFLGGNQKMLQETEDAFKLLQQAENLGSIMKFDLSDSTHGAIAIRLKEWEQQAIIPENIQKLSHSFKLILALTTKYSALVMNPPYMSGSNMNNVLSNYVKCKYVDGKADLFSTFMILAIDRLISKGKYGMINMHSWMFLSSFERLRHSLLDNEHIDSLLHLGPRTFDELNGEVVQNAAYVITKDHYTINKGVYFRLVEGKNCGEKERIFHDAQHNHTDKVYYLNIEQENFEKIPGCPIGYWVSSNIFDIFESNTKIVDFSPARIGMMTTDNVRFLRFWHEIGYHAIGFSYKSREEAASSMTKWFPYNKGGGFKKWYGLNELIVNWQFGGKEIIENGMTSFRGKDFYFKEGITWSFISSTVFGVRYKPHGFIFDIQGSSSFPPTKGLFNLTAYLNSKVANKFLSILNPTLSFQGGNINSLPYKIIINPIIDNLSEDSIAISKLDWDSHETSWDFQENSINSLRQSLLQEDVKALVNILKQEWEVKFMQLHHNEEELNRQFIEIYGLQSELTPDVPLDEITILQQGEISIEDNKIVWHDDVLMKQLISYAIGCWMGRYRLDKPGLWIAHPNATEEEICTYDYHGQQFEIDDDGIIPLLSQYSNFPDNGYKRVEDFLRIAFGEDTLTDNINFVQEALGMSIEKYMQKEFWKYHKKMYQNRPIYWLFSSKRGAFQCLAYMHRMNAYTVEQIRSKYLLPHIEWLKNRITEMESRASSLKTNERRVKEQMQKDLTECLEYHDSLHLVADQQISFDLDDGVVKNYSLFGDVLAKLR